MIKYSDEAVERAVKRTAEKAFLSAKDKCPVRTGQLKNSITLKTEKDRAEIFTDVEYAAAVELGTNRQRAQPYLSYGINEAAKSAARIFGEELL